jgi:HJR/Mrr/RecB family endonuclease
MARLRRNRDLDIALAVAQLIALFVVVAICFPPVRQIVLNLGLLLIGAIILAGVVASGVFLIRRLARKSAFSSAELRVLDAISESDQTTNTPQHPQTTPNLIEQVRSFDWFQFEKLVALTYRKLGYTVTRRGGANPDGGIDLVIEKDFQRTAVQCKQWKTWNVGVRAVREFLGALKDADIQRGIFITLRGYTGDAKQLAERHSIEIVNEIGLSRMLEETSARFDPETLAILMDTRKFCPKCESEMVLRTARKGVGAGSHFWGCATFPRCRFTMQV